MVRLLFLPLLMIMAVQCNHHPFHKPVADGGPCSYDSIRFSAKVLEIKLMQNHPEDSLYEVKVYTPRGPGRDTLLLNHMLGHDINADYLRKHNINTGGTISGMHFYITKGTCTPEIYRFDDGEIN